MALFILILQLVMPKVAIFKNLIFFIFSYDLEERWHIHIVNTKKKRGKAAKIWLNPVKPYQQGDLSDKEFNQALELIEEHKAALKKVIADFKKGNKTKILILPL